MDSVVLTVVASYLLYIQTTYCDADQYPLTQSKGTWDESHQKCTLYGINRHGEIDSHYLNFTNTFTNEFWIGGHVNYISLGIRGCYTRRTRPNSGFVDMSNPGNPINKCISRCNNTKIYTSQSKCFCVEDLLPLSRPERCKAVVCKAGFNNGICGKNIDCLCTYNVVSESYSTYSLNTQDNCISCNLNYSILCKEKRFNPCQNQQCGLAKIGNALDWTSSMITCINMPNFNAFNSECTCLDETTWSYRIYQKSSQMWGLPSSTSKRETCLAVNKNKIIEKSCNTHLQALCLNTHPTVKEEHTPYTDGDIYTEINSISTMRTDLENRTSGNKNKKRLTLESNIFLLTGSIIGAVIILILIFIAIYISQRNAVLCKRKPSGTQEQNTEPPSVQSNNGKRHIEQTGGTATGVSKNVQNTSNQAPSYSYVFENKFVVDTTYDDLSSIRVTNVDPTYDISPANDLYDHAVTGARIVETVPDSIYGYTSGYGNDNGEYDHLNIKGACSKDVDFSPEYDDCTKLGINRNNRACEHR